MVDPTRVTNYNRTEAELQEFLLFCIAVAGKNANHAARSCNEIVRRTKDNTPCFWYFFQEPHVLHNYLVTAHVGQYTRLERAVRQLADLLAGTRSASTLTLDELLGIYGIGPKTARFFLLHTRPNAQYAVLDTHVMAWLRSVFATDLSRPPSDETEYAKLEAHALGIYEYYFPRHLSLAEIDLRIWLIQSGRLDGQDLLDV